MSCLVNYIKYVERLYKSCEGEKLSRILSLTDKHVLDKNLRGEIALLVAQHCKTIIGDVISGHLYCAWAVLKKDFIEAYRQQTMCVIAIVKILQNLQGQNWCLPLMYTICMELRLVAQEAYKVHGDCGILEKAAESLLSCFQVCVDDKQTSHEQTKRVGLLYLVNQLMMIYFRINKLDLYNPLISAIDSSGLWNQFPLKQQVTYSYFVGIKAVLNSDYSAAHKYLSFAFQNCHGQNQNERRILTYLTTVKILLGYNMPTADLLQKNNLLQFVDLISTIENGDSRGIDRIMEEHESFFKSAGLYLTIKKMKIMAYRNLFKKVYLAENNHLIDIASFQVALEMMGEDVDLDETQRIIENLTFQGLINGYISDTHKKVVLSRENAFPTLGI